MTISIKNLHFTYTGEKESGQKIFADFNLETGEESPTVLLGPSGCGKSTILKLIAGILKPESGEISFSECGQEQPTVKKSYMFQDPRLLPWLSIFENVMLPIKKKIPNREAKARAMHFLELVSLARKAKLHPSTLSGGEQQRASMARAFTFDAPILLLDEPFQSLDVPLRISLMDTLLRLLENDKRTCVLVTHDPREALYLGERILVINKSDEYTQVVLDELCSDAAGHCNCEDKKRSYTDPSNYEFEQRLIGALA